MFSQGVSNRTHDRLSLPGTFTQGRSVSSVRELQDGRESPEETLRSVLGTVLLSLAAQLKAGPVARGESEAA